MNYFQMFGMTESFTVDTAQLAQTFQQLQRAVHPDKFAHASSQEQLVAVQKSATINDAYQTLKQPLLRAQYILTLRGTEMPEEQSTIGDMQFLMRQMELREMLEDVANASDIDDALFAARDELDQEYAQLFLALEQQIAENSEQANSKASETIRKLKFYQKLHIELDRLEDQLLDD